MIYLASPYSHPDEKIRESNYRKIATLAAKMIAEGKVVISPVAYGHNLLSFHEMPSDWQFWQNFCVSILHKCDELVVCKMEGWEFSRGVAEEIALAEKHGIPVKYIEDELHKT